MADGSIKYDFEYLSEGAIEGFLMGRTAQMSMKRGIRELGDSGVDVVHKEMKKINDIGVPIPVDPRKLSSKTKAAALKYLIFLKMKQYGKVKGRGCDGGRYQQEYVHKDDSSSPTVATESLMISCVIDDMRQHTSATVDIPGDFLQADMYKLVYFKFEGLMAELLSKIYPNIYEK